ncbi:MAG TPA: hypothetical protein PKW33_18735 [Anaerolineaceae bacterium]|nr:hypothetical protein [Anaerolineaceae bacterium]HPN53639.1 hypothetical protein [Anaerolineaceae bacterium]
MTRFRSFLIAVMVIMLFALGFSMAGGFAEEEAYFIDPYAVPTVTTDDAVSTVHNDMTYALALAAGFSEDDSRTLQIYNQLVDSEALGVTSTVAYTNCSGSFKPTPVSGTSAVCPNGDGNEQVIWPMWENMTDKTACFTSRFGPYSPFFHFPNNNAQELGAIRAWAWGQTDTLEGYSAYAWGGVIAGRILKAACTYKQYETIDTGDVKAGSLEAFGTYLHSMADYYSHRDCLAALAALPTPAPWGTHTQKDLSGNPTVYACDYNPANWQNDDAHGREFGTAYPSDAARTKLALKMVLLELSARSLQREGLYYPLNLQTPISIPAVPAVTNLEEAIDYFVDTWAYDAPLQRRAFTDQLVYALKNMTRKPAVNLYLPLLTK